MLISRQPRPLKYNHFSPEGGTWWRDAVDSGTITAVPTQYLSLSRSEVAVIEGRSISISHRLHAYSRQFALSAEPSTSLSKKRKTVAAGKDRPVAFS